MKKSFSKSFAAIIISAVIFQMPVLAQVKTNFTPEVRASEDKPTGIASGEHIEERNKVDVKVPKKTRGVERYNKLNIWGNVIPDSFLFYRNVLNQKQQAVYDAAYKALMKNEVDVTLPVGLTENEFYDTMHALDYDNPEAFWWDNDYSYWTNSDDTVTRFVFKYWLDSSEFEQKYEKFWNATAPILFYASTLPDEMSKIKYIHDYICLSTEYANDIAGTNNNGGKYQTAYSGAVEYRTICGGYAALFQYYMQQLGIPCAKIRSQTHAWNFLQVNGQYYQMDVTWNDTEIIPNYYNLTHEEMQNIKSHTPWDLEKKFIDAHPSTGNQMSYLEYFGALYEGSPYTYQELNYFDYEKSTGTLQPVMIYKNEPKILSIVKNADELITAINQTYGSNYADGTIFTFFIPTVEEKDRIIERINDPEMLRWHGGTWNWSGNSIIYNLTLAAPTKKSEDIIVDDTPKNTESKTAKKTKTVVPPKIGDKGPGGGIVFYIEGNKAYECSEILGKEDWETAKDLCKDYRGGGKSDWYLPDKDQLNYIYMNLRKTGIIKDQKWYWSSSTSYDIYAWYQQFSDGKQDYYYEDSEGSVRAVRSFEY